MNYTLLIYVTPAELARRSEPAYWETWPRYLQALKDAGVHVSGAGLELPSTAATVRLQDGARLVQDGPFADTKEQLGGFFVINVPNAEAALDWAARCPVQPGGVVEVRACLMPPTAESKSR